MPSSSLRSFLPTAGLMLGAIISGLAWLPLRAIANTGVAGLWVTLSIIAVACLFLLPGVVRVRALARRDIAELFWIAALIGVSFSFYAASLMTTDVARAVLLFYISPVWGTLLEVVVLRQPFTAHRAAALIFGGAGLGAILHIGLDFQLVMNLGDALALLSGVLWSVGLLFVFGRDGPSLAAQSCAVALGALAGAVVMVLTLEDAPVPELSVLGDAWPWIIGTSLVFVLPLWVLSLWAGRRISPARATLIFMAEVCVGVGSAALWAGQPFGAHEIAGTVLLLAAAAVEFVGAASGAKVAPQATPPS